jgi:hypothetical protein
MVYVMNKSWLQVVVLVRYIQNKIDHDDEYKNLGYPKFEGLQIKPPM